MCVSMSESNKVIFVGNASSGKTTICRKLLGCNNEKKYIPTMGVEVHPYMVELAGGMHGNIYKIWDCAGNPKFGGLRSGYYIGTSVAFIFHGGKSFLTPEEWENDVKSVAPHAIIFHIKGTLQEKYDQVKELF